MSSIAQSLLKYARWATLPNGWKAVAFPLNEKTVLTFTLVEWLPEDEQVDQVMYIYGHCDQSAITDWGEHADFSLQQSSESQHNYYTGELVGWKIKTLVEIDGVETRCTEFIPVGVAGIEARHERLYT